MSKPCKFNILFLGCVTNEIIIICKSTNTFQIYETPPNFSFGGLILDKTVSDPNFEGMAVFTPVINGE